MPNNSGNVVTLPVQLEIQNLQGSVANIRKQINDGLKSDSSSFKALNRQLGQLETQLGKVSGMIAAPFGSQKQFNETEKALTRINNIVGTMNTYTTPFGDLKLSQQDMQALTEMEQKITNLKNTIKSLQDEVYADFTKTNGDALRKIMPNYEEFDLDELAKKLKTGSNKVQNEIDALTQKVEQWRGLKQKRTSLENIANATDESSRFGALRQIEGFSDIWRQNLSFNAGGKEKLKQVLAEQLQMTDADITSIMFGDKGKELSGKAVSEKLQQYIKDMVHGNSGIYKNIASQFDEKAFTQDSRALDEKIAKLEQFKQVLSSIPDVQQRMGTVGANEKEEIELMKEAIVRYQEYLEKKAAAGKQDWAAGASQEVRYLINNLQQANAEFLKMQRLTNSFNSLKTTVTNFMGFYQVLNLIRRGIREAAKTIKELDTVMNGIAIVTNMTTADLWGQVSTYTEMAQRYGVTLKGTYEVSKIYYQQGLQTNDVLTLTNETLKLAKISGMDYAETTDYMTTALRGFKIEMQDASRVVDVYSALAANTAVSQQELAVAMSKTASSLESVGASFEQSSAMIATMVAVTRESATNIGSALKSIASRYGELTKDPSKLIDEEGEVFSFNKVDTALQSVGISLQDSEHQFRNFADVIAELSKVWDDLDSTQQRYIATQFAGNRQQSRFLALVSNYDLYKQNLEVAENSDDTGTLQANKALDSLESKINQVKGAYQQFYTTIGAESAWKAVLDSITSIINSFNRLPKLFGKIPVVAVSTILDIVTLLKNVLSNAISSLAANMIEAIKTKIEKNDLAKTTEEQVKKAGEGAAKESEKQGEKVAHGFMGSLRRSLDKKWSDVKGGYNTAVAKHSPQQPTSQEPPKPQSDNQQQQQQAAAGAENNAQKQQEAAAATDGAAQALRQEGQAAQEATGAVVGQAAAEEQLAKAQQQQQATAEQAAQASRERGEAAQQGAEAVVEAAKAEADAVQQAADVAKENILSPEYLAALNKIQALGNQANPLSGSFKESQANRSAAISALNTLYANPRTAAVLGINRNPIGKNGLHTAELLQRIKEVSSRAEDIKNPNFDPAKQAEEVKAAAQAAAEGIKQEGEAAKETAAEIQQQAEAEKQVEAAEQQVQATIEKVIATIREQVPAAQEAAEAIANAAAAEAEAMQKATEAGQEQNKVLTAHFNRTTTLSPAMQKYLLEPGDGYKTSLFSRIQRKANDAARDTPNWSQQSRETAAANLTERLRDLWRANSGELNVKLGPVDLSNPIESFNKLKELVAQTKLAPQVDMAGAREAFDAIKEYIKDGDSLNAVLKELSAFGLNIKVDDSARSQLDAIVQEVEKLLNTEKALESSDITIRPQTMEVATAMHTMVVDRGKERPLNNILSSDATKFLHSQNPHPANPKSKATYLEELGTLEKDILEKRYKGWVTTDAEKALSEKLQSIYKEVPELELKVGPINIDAPLETLKQLREAIRLAEQPVSGEVLNLDPAKQAFFELKDQVKDANSLNNLLDVLRSKGLNILAPDQSAYNNIQGLLVELEKIVTTTENLSGKQIYIKVDSTEIREVLEQTKQAKDSVDQLGQTSVKPSSMSEAREAFDAIKEYIKDAGSLQDALNILAEYKINIQVDEKAKEDIQAVAAKLQELMTSGQDLTNKEINISIPVAPLEEAAAQAERLKQETEAAAATPTITVDIQGAREAFEVLEGTVDDASSLQNLLNALNSNGLSIKVDDSAKENVKATVQEIGKLLQSEEALSGKDIVINIQAPGLREAADQAAQLRQDTEQIQGGGAQPSITPSPVPANIQGAQEAFNGLKDTVNDATSLQTLLQAIDQNGISIKVDDTAKNNLEALMIEIQEILKSGQDLSNKEITITAKDNGLAHVIHELKQVQQAAAGAGATAEQTGEQHRQLGDAATGASHEINKESGALDNNTKKQGENSGATGNNATAHQGLGSSAGSMAAGIWGALGTNTARSWMNSIRMVLNTFAMQQDTSTRQGQKASGTLQAVGGGVSLIGGIASHNPMMIMQGLMSLWGGLSTFFENAEERAERLKKEAEEARKAMQEESANYKTLQQSQKKLSQLQATRYDSEEAAEEYQNAVDNIIQSFPELISGYDVAGNAIIDNASLEIQLAEARKKTAKATYDAAKAEAKAAADLYHEQEKTITNNSSKTKRNNFKYTVDAVKAVQAHSSNDTDMISYSDQLKGAKDTTQEVLDLLKKANPENFAFDADLFLGGANNYTDPIDAVLNGLVVARDVDLSEPIFNYLFDQINTLLNDPNNSLSSDEINKLKSFQNLLLLLPSSEAFIGGRDENGNEIKARFNNQKNMWFKDLNEDSSDENTFAVSALNEVNAHLNELAATFQGAETTEAIINASDAIIRYYDEQIAAFGATSIEGSALLERRNKFIQELYGDIETFQQLRRQASQSLSVLGYAYQQVNHNNAEYIKNESALMSIGGDILGEIVKNQYKSDFESAENNSTFIMDAAALEQVLNTQYLKWSGQLLEDGTTMAETFDKAFADRTQWNGQELIKYFNIPIDPDNQIYTSIMNSSQELSDKYYEMLKNNFGEDNPIIKAISGQLEEKDANGYSTRQLSMGDFQFLTAFGKQVEKFRTKGLNYAASSLESVGNALFQQISGLDAETNNAIITSLIKNNALSSKEGMVKAIQELTAGGIISEGDETYQQLTTYAETFLTNVSLSLQAATDSLFSSLEDKGKTLSKGLSGMSVKEAGELIDTLENYGIEGFGWDSFEIGKGGKLVVKESEQQNYANALYTWAEEQRAAATSDYNNAQKWLKELHGFTIGQLMQEIGHGNEQAQAALDFLLANNIVIKNERGYYELANGYNTLQDALKALGVELETENNQLIEGVNRIVYAMVYQQQWAIGDYKEIMTEGYSTIQDLLQADQNNLTEGQKEAVDYANNAYSTLIKDVIKKGKVDVSKYKGFDETTTNRLQQNIDKLDKGSQNLLETIYNISKERANDIETLLDDQIQALEEISRNNVSIGSMTGKASFSASEAKNIAIALGYDTTTGKDLNAFLSDKGFIYNIITNTYTPIFEAVEETQKTAFDTLIDYWAEQASQGNAVAQTYVDMYKAQAERMRAEGSTNLSAVKSFMTNSNTTEEQIREVAEALGSSYTEVANTVHDGQVNVIELLQLASEHNQAAADYIKDHIGSTLDKSVTTLTNGLTYLTSGTAKFSDLETFINDYNATVLDAANKLSIDDFQYSTATHNFILSPDKIQQIADNNRAIMKELFPDQSNDMWIDDYIQQQKNAALNITSLGDFAGKETHTKEDMQATWVTLQGLKASFSNIDDEKITNWFNDLALGGEAAVEALIAIQTATGYEFSAEQFENAATSQVKRLQSYADTVSELEKGSYVGDATLRAALEKAGYTFNNGFITTVGNVIEAYSFIYTAMKNSSKATLTQLNALYAKILSESEKSQSLAIEALSNASSMTYDTLGTMLAQVGISLEDAISDLQGYGLTQLGGGKIRIADFSAFAAKLNLDTDSDEYLSAYSAYVDSMIEVNKAFETKFREQADKVINGKAGEQINISYLTNRFGEELLSNIFGGPDIDKGILTLNEAMTQDQWAQFYQILEASGEYTQSELAELKDNFQERFINSFTDGIKKGLEGSLSNADMQDLISRSTGLDENAFVKTENGFKLTTNAAIQLYNELKAIDSVAANIVLTQLNEDLKESNDHYKTTADIVERIEYLRDQVNSEDNTISDARKKQYEAELEIAKEILRVRATTANDEFDYMNQSLPEVFKRPTDLAKSAVAVTNAFREAWNTSQKAMNIRSGEMHTSKGLMGMEDFYNMANMMNNMAQASGQEIKLAGITLDGSIEAFSQLVNKGYSELEVLSDGSQVVNLGNIGLTFETGASAMNKGVQDGVQEIAKGQVEMLDSMIQVVETMVAMEQLGDALGEDIILDLPQIIINKNDPNYNTAIESIDIWRQSLLEKLNPKNENFDKDLSKAAHKVSVGGKTLNDILHTSAKSWTETEAAIATGFYKAAKSGNLSEDNIWQSIVETMQGVAEFDGKTIELGSGDNKITYTFKDGFALEMDKNGKYTVDGETFDNIDDAVRASILANLQNTNLDGKDEVGNITGTMTIGAKKLKVSIDSDKNITYTFQGQTGRTPEEAMRKAYTAYSKHMTGLGKEDTILSYEEWKIRVGLTVVPEIGKDSNINLTPEQKKNLQGETKTSIEQAWADAKEKGTEIEFEAKYGFKLGATGEITDEQLAQLLADNDIEDITKNVTLNFTNPEAEKILTDGDVYKTIHITEDYNGSGNQGSNGSSNNSTPPPKGGNSASPSDDRTQYERSESSSGDNNGTEANASGYVSNAEFTTVGANVFFIDSSGNKNTIFHAENVEATADGSVGADGVIIKYDGNTGHFYLYSADGKTKIEEMTADQFAAYANSTVLAGTGVHLVWNGDTNGFDLYDGNNNLITQLTADQAEAMVRAGYAYLADPKNPRHNLHGLKMALVNGDLSLVDTNGTAVSKLTSKEIKALVETGEAELTDPTTGKVIGKLKLNQANGMIEVLDLNGSKIDTLQSPLLDAIINARSGQMMTGNTKLNGIRGVFVDGKVTVYDLNGTPVGSLRSDQLDALIREGSQQLYGPDGKPTDYLLKIDEANNSIVVYDKNGNQIGVFTSGPIPGRIDIRNPEPLSSEFKLQYSGATTGFQVIDTATGLPLVILGTGTGEVSIVNGTLKKNDDGTISFTFADGTTGNTYTVDLTDTGISELIQGTGLTVDGQNCTAEFNQKTGTITFKYQKGDGSTVTYTVDMSSIGELTGTATITQVGAALAQAYRNLGFTDGDIDAMMGALGFTKNGNDWVYQLPNSIAETTTTVQSTPEKESAKNFGLRWASERKNPNLNAHAWDKTVYKTDDHGSTSQVVLNDDASNYYKQIKEKVNNQQPLTATEQDFLNFLSQNKQGKVKVNSDDGEGYIDVTKGEIEGLLEVNKELQNSMIETFGSLPELANVDYTNLESLATSLSAISTSAIILQTINWNAIIKGLEALTGLQVNETGMRALGDLASVLTAISGGQSTNSMGVTFKSEGLTGFAEAMVTLSGIAYNSINTGLSNLAETLGLISAAMGNQLPKVPEQPDSSQEPGAQTTNEPANIDVDLSGLQEGTAEFDAAIEEAMATLSEEAAKAEDVPTKMTKAVELFGKAMQLFNSKVQSGINKLNSVSTTHLIEQINNLVKALGTDLDASSIKSTFISTVNSQISSQGYKLQEYNKKGVTGDSLAKSNIGPASAAGTQTLMGELGPELYVSNGRYYLAGENGAEFVNLPNDAIVFNHLQTHKLLATGSTGRGKPITNERNAVAFAAGSGPAQASASSVLATLKALREMWRNLASNTSLSQLAGLGGGGGGGGGRNYADFTKELEKWFNLLQKIAKLERDITHQETLRNKLESDRLINGNAIYESQKRTLDALKQQIVYQRELANLQKTEYETRRQQLEEHGLYSQIFNFDSNGVLTYQNIGAQSYKEQGWTQAEEFNGGSILEFLAWISRQESNGAAHFSPQQQLNILQNTFGENFRSIINLDAIEKGLDWSKSFTEEQIVAILQQFYDNVDSTQQEMIDLNETYNETENNILELQQKENELMKQIVDNQIDLENKVLSAIEAREQKAIDEATKEKERFSKAATALVDGLNKQLENEKQRYQREQEANNLTKMRRQLAILQRTGGSQSQIAQLQSQIDAAAKDAYFNAQSDQINAIKEASDQQIERLDTQIQIMTETLQYQKENGLFWNEVQRIMSMDENSILQFLQENNPDYRSKSELQIREDVNALRSIVEQWLGYRNDPDMQNTINNQNNQGDTENTHGQDVNNINEVWAGIRDVLWNSYGGYNTSETFKKNFDEIAGQAFFETFYQTYDVRAAQEAARAALDFFIEVFDIPRIDNTSSSSGIIPYVYDALQYQDEMQSLLTNLPNQHFDTNNLSSLRQIGLNLPQFNSHLDSLLLQRQLDQLQGQPITNIVNINNPVIRNDNDIDKLSNAMEEKMLAIAKKTGAYMSVR